MCSGDVMKQVDYERIKEYNDLIEKNRLEIKKYNEKKDMLHDRMDTLGNIYEYFVLSSCSISVLIMNFLSGPSIYVLPTLSAFVAAGVISGKFIARKRLDKLNKKIKDAKTIRRNAYDDKEKVFEKIFESYNNKGLDDKGYYKEIVRIEEMCQKKTAAMNRKRIQRDKVAKIRNMISRVFSYVLAPVSVIGIPLLCALGDIGPAGEVALTIGSNIVLFTCATIDDHLTKKVDNIVEEIDKIKEDRTIAYIKRDVRINDALRYWKLNSEKYNSSERKAQANNYRTHSMGKLK